MQIFYNQAESFELEVVNGPEAAVNPARPGKLADGLLLADVLLTQGQTQIFNADIDETTNGRRDWAFELLASSPAQVKAQAA